jgi:hypothetical protein
MSMPMGDTGPQAPPAGTLVLDGPIQVRNGGLTLMTDGAAGLTSGLALTGQTTQAGASTGTLTNAPAATNPTFWLPVNINGVLRKIPCW